MWLRGHSGIRRMLRPGNSKFVYRITAGDSGFARIAFQRVRSTAHLAGDAGRLWRPFRNSSNRSDRRGRTLSLRRQFKHAYGRRQIDATSEAFPPKCSHRNATVYRARKNSRNEMAGPLGFLAIRGAGDVHEVRPPRLAGPCVPSPGSIFPKAIFTKKS